MFDIGLADTWAAFGNCQKVNPSGTQIGMIYIVTGNKTYPSEQRRSDFIETYTLCCTREWANRAMYRSDKWSR